MTRALSPAWKSHRVPVEVESALVFTQQPSTVAARIARLRTLNGFELVARKSRHITDRYLDTPDLSLRAALVGLRVRLEDGEPWLTLKGPGGRRRGLTRQRFELDRPWSQAAAGRILQMLASIGRPLGRRTASREWQRPEDFVAGTGLIEVQVRETVRAPRDVYARNRRTDDPLAEMAIDLVTYHLGRRRVRLGEVEVEAKRPNGVAVANAVSALVLEHDPERISAWPHSKFAMGLALRGLESEGRLEAIVGSGGWITRAGYTAISRWLAARHA